MGEGGGTNLASGLREWVSRRRTQLLVVPTEQPPMCARIRVSVLYFSGRLGEKGGTLDPYS